MQSTQVKVDISAADWNHDVLTFSAINLPAGAKIDSATQTFTWTPTKNQVGTYTVTVTASDGKLQDSMVFDINVENAQIKEEPQPSEPNPKKKIHIRIE